MNIVLYTIGFVALLCAIFVFLLAIVKEFPMRSEPELLVVDESLPGDDAPAFEEEAVAEAQA